MSDEMLKPCPFCGSSAHITEEDGLFFAGCDECFCAVGEAYDGCAMPKHCFFEAAAAAKAWNTRAAASAEPVAWRWRIKSKKPSDVWNYDDDWKQYADDQIEREPLYTHPAPDAEIVAALEEIASWKNDTLGPRPKERGPYDCAPEITEAFDRGARMAFYRCADRALAALAKAKGGH